MPSPITWYALGRAEGDNESISAAIDASLLAHNLDPSAHSQSNEAITNHRSAPVLDHVSYSIYNIKTAPSARVYRAIVAPGLDGDFTSLQAAIDWADLYGGGTIFIKAGTYHLTSDINLKSNITLQGEDDDLTIFTFDSRFFGFRIVGTSGTHKTNICINDIQITACKNTDQGVIVLAYADDIFINGVYFNANNDPDYTPVADIEIQNTTTRLQISYCRFVNSAQCILLQNCSNVQVYNNYFDKGNNEALVVYIGAVTHVQVIENYFVNSIYPAIYSDASCNGVIVTGNTIIKKTTGTVYEGIVFDGGTDIIVTNNYIDSVNKSIRCIAIYSGARYQILGNSLRDATGSGIYLTDSSYSIVNGNLVYSCGAYGVDIANAGCSKNIVTSNMARSCTSGAVHDVGTNTSVNNNVNA